MKKLCDWIKNIFAAIRINWGLFLFFNSKKKQKKFEQEMKEITENVKRKEEETARINELKKARRKPHNQR